MSCPGWAGVFDPDDEVIAWSREPQNGQTMALAALDPARIAYRRCDIYYIPRCLRPDLCLTLGPED